MCDTTAPAPGPSLPDAYRRCRACGGLSLVAYPAAQDNAVFDDPDGAARQAALERQREAYFLRHLQRVTRHLPEPGRLLEIGCGSGVMLRLAAERGWRTSALELSPALADLARAANPSATITCGDVADATGGQADHDAVLLLDVIEHVLDPGSVLRHCAAHLAPGGVLLVQTPNVSSLRHLLAGPRWEMRDPAQHVNLFTPRGLVGLLEQCGFSVETLETVGGTGLERGWRRAAVVVRDRALGMGRLGAALCVVARV